jgi:hypothetical protein
MLGAFVLLGPSPAWACAACVASAYGDRTFNWAFLGLILMPFVVGLGIGGVLLSRHRSLQAESKLGPSRGADTGTAQLTHEESSL